MKPATSPRMGRPRSFDRGQAVARAMELFWALGYEGTTLTDLQQAMGDISAPSFYAAFGSKEQLFREAVEFYTQTQRAPMARALNNQPHKPRSREYYARRPHRFACRANHGAAWSCLERSTAQTPTRVSRTSCAANAPFGTKSSGNASSEA